MLKIRRRACERVHGFRSDFEEEMTQATLGCGGGGGWGGVDKIKGIGNHRFNDFTVRGRRHEEGEGENCLTASSVRPATQSFSLMDVL